jgi:hypothetical protein
LHEGLELQQQLLRAQPPALEPQPQQALRLQAL